MNPYVGAVLGSAFTALVGLLVFAVRSKSKESAKEVFQDLIVGALAVWEKNFTDRIRSEGVLELSARDYLKITEASEKVWNGRYWLAAEARDAVRDLHRSMEANTEKLHARISRLGDEFENKLVRVAGELDAKIRRLEDRLDDKVDKT